MSTQRVAIVTGAARGIGAATAERLGRDGFAVGVLDLDEAACEAVAAGSATPAAGAVGVGVDVTDAAQVEAGVARVADELGPPVVLVNNAGIIRDNLIFKMTEADWDAVMNVHLKGAFLMTRACQAHMTAEKYGRIVNLSSSSAQGNRGQANYSAAKAGLQGFTKTLAIELGKFGVTANAVAPGFIQTDMTAATAERIGVAVRGLHRPHGPADPGRAGRPARGHRGDHRLPGVRGGRLRLRPGHLRRRRPARLTPTHCDPPTSDDLDPGTAGWVTPQ